MAPVPKSVLLPRNVRNSSGTGRCVPQIGSGSAYQGLFHSARQDFGQRMHTHSSCTTLNLVICSTFRDINMPLLSYTVGILGMRVILTVQGRNGTTRTGGTFCRVARDARCLRVLEGIHAWKCREGAATCLDARASFFEIEVHRGASCRLCRLVDGFRLLRTPFSTAASAWKGWTGRVGLIGYANTSD